MTKKLLILILILGTIPTRFKSVGAIECPDVELVFARGSGEVQNENASFKAFQDSLAPKLSRAKISYHFTDLSYPAIAVDNFGVLVGAFISGGEAYSLGSSINTGVDNLLSLVSSSCKNTKFVLAGYSQGAIVLDKALPKINPEKIIYVATFGDPKLYLPEGEGLFPAACQNKNLSSYRAYVPDCHAFEGILGSIRPYEPGGYSDKIGTWCNKKDIMCSSHFSITDHTSYISENLYVDASKIIFDKITSGLGLKNTETSPHDTAILIDSTGSMEFLIEKYKTEAIRLAKETLNSGGRVALYDYRDLADPYLPHAYCSFETCTLDSFIEGINQIKTDGGGDMPESLLSAAFAVMKELNWRFGATKSLVVLTDSGFHQPDRDGTGFIDVVSLSRKIDPVNFYVITEPETAPEFEALTRETDGAVYTNLDELSLVTDHIMARYDSLPRVEPEESSGEDISLNILETSLNEVAFTVKFETSADEVLVVLNDAILGLTKEREITLNSLDLNTDNTLRLIPIKNSRKGTPATLEISRFVPGVPNTGGH